MLSFFAKKARQASALASAILLSACVITTDSAVFETDDFTLIEGISGDWKFTEDNEGTQDEFTVRVSPASDRRYDVVVLENGVPSEAEGDQLIVALVDLPGGAFILVNQRLDESEPFEYLGLTIAGNEMQVYMFGATESLAAEKALQALIAQHDLKRDPAMKYEVRLAVATKDRLRALFPDLMAQPSAYEPTVSRYERVAAAP